ncbi:hypothetical protein IWX65_002043 [Arthrobacter sp. CAN_A214]
MELIAIPIRPWWKKRNQVCEIWAGIDELWEPEGDYVSHKMPVGRRLVVRKPTARPVEEVLVMKPNPIQAMQFKHIGPQSKAEMLLPGRLTFEISGELVVLQVTGNQCTTWWWTPTKDRAELLGQRSEHLSKMERRAARNVRSRLIAVESPVPEPRPGKNSPPSVHEKAHRAQLDRTGR